MNQAIRPETSEPGAKARWDQDDQHVALRRARDWKRVFLRLDPNVPRRTHDASQGKFGWWKEQSLDESCEINPAEFTMKAMRWTCRAASPHASG